MSLVSVIMPMRNARPFVADALRSVLRQDGVELEIIVVDDGSTDGSGDVVRAMDDARIRMVIGPGKGIAAAFNTGLAAARGELLARCDADDLFAPERLKWQVELLNRMSDFGGVCGYYSTIDPRGKFVAEKNGEYPPEEVTQELRTGIGRSHMCAYLFRTDVIRKLGGCRTWFVTAEDRDLQFRLPDVARVWYEPRPAYIYRLHDASITHTKASRLKEFYNDAAREFQEQRAAGLIDDLDRGQPPDVPVFTNGEALSSAAEIQHLLISRAWRSHRAGKRSEAISDGWKACLARPLGFFAWKSFVMLMLKPPGREARPAPAQAAERGS